MKRLHIKLYQTRAQTLLEYSVILGVITAVVFAMNPMIKRASQGAIKLVADQIGNQEAADQFSQSVGNEEFEPYVRGGHLINSVTESRSTSIKRRLEDVGDLEYEYDDTTVIGSEQKTDLGFRESN